MLCNLDETLSQRRVVVVDVLHGPVVLLEYASLILSF
jgi:hypothetical protein